MKTFSQYLCITALSLVAALVDAPSAAADASDFVGTWTGTATFEDMRFDYQLTLHQSGAGVEGEIQIRGGGQVARYAVEGVLNGQTMTFSGTRWVQRGGNFCMASGQLTRARPRPNVELLTGWWGPNPPSGCPDGSYGGVYLRRQP